MSVHQCKIYL